MFSMLQNAGLISLVYPFSLFGYALLEESRPSKTYWKFIQMYTVLIILLKFALTLDIFGSYINKNKVLLGYIKLGFHKYSDILDRFLYFSPEILILTLLMLNEVRLKLYGLYYVVEQDVETIKDAV